MKRLIEKLREIGETLWWVFTRMGPGVRGIVIVTILTYLIQIGIERHTGALIVSWLDVSGPMAQRLMLSQKTYLPSALFALSAEGLRNDFWWQLLTYMFMHGSVMHLLLNMFMVGMFGTAIERGQGTRRMLRIYFASGIRGGLGWLLLGEFWTANHCVGASAGAFGLIGAFCGLYPNRPVALFGVIEMRARTLAILLGVASLVNLLWGTKNVAYSAHLVGGVIGYAIGAGVTLRRGGKPGWRLPHFRRRPRLTVLEGGGAPTIESVKAKVDREGLSSLSERERRLLRESVEGGPRESGE